MNKNKGYNSVPWINSRIHDFMDKMLHKKSYDYYATIKKVSQGLAGFFDYEKICSFIGDVIISTLQLRNIVILSSTVTGEFKVLYQQSRDSLTHYAQGSLHNNKNFKINEKSEIVKLLRSSEDIIIFDKLHKRESEIGRGTVKTIKNELKALRGKLAVPVIVDNKLELILVLGEKVSGRSFNFEDTNMLNTIANQTSIAVKHARVHEEKLRSEKLASIGIMSITLAHEIRNPLTSLKTFAQLMPEKYHDAEFRNKFSHIVLGEIERINGLIEDLLDVSSKKKSPGINIFDVRGLLDDMVTYLNSKLELEKRNVTIHKDYESVEVNVLGNAKRLQHAFFNILNNGCQAMNGQGELRINVLSNENNIDIAITDNGHGIPPEYINSIYEPFVTTKEMGMGLGLTISKKIIEDHGGKIKVQSNVLEGTKFTVSLPLSDF